MRRYLLVMAAALVALCSGCAPSDLSQSGLRMSQMYTDGMVLQRNIPLVIKGHANSGERVKVTVSGPFGTMTKKDKASKQGEWAVEFKPLDAAVGICLTIEGNGGNTLVYDDVAAGEVWVCSGQSNMYFKVWESAESGEAAADKDLRLFNMEIPFHLSMVEWSDEHVELARSMEFYRPTQWQACDGENVRGFSAVAYNFGKKLREQLGVPVGLICNAIGGSPTEAWISRDDLAEGYPEVLEDWFNNPMVNQWCVEMGKINLGYPENNFANHPFAPACLFETGVATMEQFPIKGVIWYQGESNDFDIPMHEKLFGLLVDSWRDNWNNPEMPFHFVQLAGLHDRYNWPEFRDSQRRMAEAMPHCDMAVSSDVADSLDIHPRRKRPVGERLARLSLCHDYGFDIVPCGPSIRNAVLDGRRVVLEFDFAEGLKTSDSQKLRIFEVAGADGAFVPAEAVIADDKVILSSDLESPEYVRYAWQPYTSANLVNGEGLPASTFFTTITKN